MNPKLLANRLPDIPRWVEARDFLLCGEGELYGVREEPDVALVLRDPDADFIIVVGTPEVSALHEAVARNASGGSVMGAWEQFTWLANALPGWRGTRVFLHTLPNLERLPTPSSAPVGFLGPTSLPEWGLPEDLLKELMSAAEQSDIAVSFEDGRPVSFCYAGSVTESLWDVSIDTLDAYRRRGHAALASAHMIRTMHARGKMPVWGSMEDNPGSWQLARKLGFEVVDHLVIFEPRGAR